MAGVFVLNSTGEPEALNRVHVTHEDEELQAVLEKNPNLLPGEQINPDDPRRWLIIKREMPVPGPASGTDLWSLDLLLADQDAVPTFVECKRFNDSRARREVVGQILDYAANGQYYWTKDQLRSMADETAGRRNHASLEEVLRKLCPAGRLSSVDLFFERFHANLREGQVRIVFFLEDSPLELRSIADFLNRQMERSEVLVVEARQYDHRGARIIVPILIGYTDQIRQIKKTVTPPRPVLTTQALIDAIRQRNSPEDSRVAEELVENLEGLGLKPKGFSSAINYGIEHDGDFLSIVSVTATGIWCSIPKRASERLDPDWFRKWKQKLNDIAPFYKPEALSEPTSAGAMCPRYNLLKDRLPAFVEAVREAKELLTSPEIVLEIGAEGGSLTLYGTRTGTGWEFSLKVFDCTPALVDHDEELQGGPFERRSSLVSTWEEAIALLDKHPWWRLCPQVVHPDFRSRVWATVEDRFGHGGGDHESESPGYSDRSLALWRKVCCPLDA